VSGWRTAAVAAAVLLAGAAVALAVVLVLRPSGFGARGAAATRVTSTGSDVAATSCTSARHPYPVILVPGTLVVTTWNVLGPALVKEGYCVYRFEYGDYGTAEIGGSAKKLASFIDTVLARTHAKKVSIVGHSQGGMMPRYAIKFLGDAGKIEDLIGLAPSNHGTINPAIAATGTPCEACLEQLWGSDFLKKLNSGTEAPGPVDYTVVETLDDAVLVPYTSAFLNGPSSRVTNITIQTDCPAVYVSHLGMPSDPVVVQWVKNALARTGPADPSFTPVC
jgi:triacylglycerol lipase